MRKLLITAGIALVATFGIAAPAFASVPAASTSSIVDEANLLTPSQEGQVADQIRQLDNATGDQFAVLTVTSLDDKPIEAYGREVGNTWNLGGANKNGAVLIIAMNEHKVRLAVGTGLTSTLPESVTDKIVSDTVAPALHNKNYIGGITDGLTQVGQAINPVPVSHTATGDNSTNSQVPGWLAIAGPIAAVLLLAFFVIVAVKALRDRAEAKREKALQDALKAKRLKEAEAAYEERRIAQHLAEEARRVRQQEALAKKKKLEKEKQDAYNAWAKTPEGQSAIAKKKNDARKAAEARKLALLAENARIQRVYEVALEFYKNMTGTAKQTIVKAKKATRRGLLATELATLIAAKAVVLTEGVTVEEVLNRVMTMDDFSKADYQPYVAPVRRPSSSSSSSRSRSSSYDSYGSGYTTPSYTPSYDSNSYSSGGSDYGSSGSSSDF